MSIKKKGTTKVQRIATKIRIARILYAMKETIGKHTKEKIPRMKGHSIENKLSSFLYKGYRTRFPIGNVPDMNDDFSNHRYLTTYAHITIII